MSQRQKDDMTRFVGLVVIAGVVVVAVVGGVYGVMGNFEGDTLRWVATGAVLAVPIFSFIFWRIGASMARVHVAGFDKGVDGAEKTIQAVGRGLAATASMARAARAPVRTASLSDNDDLLPKPGAMKILEPPRGDGEIIDL